MITTSLTEILKLQKSEITEHLIYRKLSENSKDTKNKKILEKISNDELRHHEFWHGITKQKVYPNIIKVYFYLFLAKIFGLAFSLKLMESGEDNAISTYSKLVRKYPKLKTTIIPDEQKHEKSLINILKDERLDYASSIVLGLNDALVELTGTLAGLSFAIANSSIIAVTGMIMGIAAALSMAASEYLSSKEESEKNQEKTALKSAVYTGIAYIITVAILVTPYLLFDNVYVSLLTMLISAIIIILLYTTYISVAKEKKFWKSFLTMAIISIGVAIISFGFGFLVKIFVGVET